MSSTDLRNMMDGLEGCKSDLYQSEANPVMYKRTVKKKVDRKGRFRTQPVTFSEIKEVDEEKVENPLTGLSGNSSDFSDNEKSSSMQVSKLNDYEEDNNTFGRT